MNAGKNSSKMCIVQKMYMYANAPEYTCLVGLWDLHH